MHFRSGGVVVKGIFFLSFFFTSHSSFLRILSLLALIPPISFPANLYSTKGPAKELMTWLKRAPNQGQALIGILTDPLCLIRILIDTISHILLLKWAHIKWICRPSFAGTDCCSLSQNIMNHKCQLWLWSKLLWWVLFCLLSINGTDSQCGSSWHTRALVIQFNRVTSPLKYCRFNEICSLYTYDHSLLKNCVC